MTSPVDRLKELLFDTEAQRLADLQRRIDANANADAARHDAVTTRQALIEQRIDQVFARTGTQERLRTSVATILDGALQDAAVTNHDKLSRALAPLMVATIKKEIKNAKPELLEAIYPMTGEMVKRYVRRAMADFAADLNRSLSGKKLTELEERAKALGVSAGDLAIAEAQALAVDELFLIKRGSGELLAHWERPVDGGLASTGEGSNRDTLIAGYLTGITAFAEEAFNETKGSLRSMDMDGQRIFIRASPQLLLAARCSGTAPPSVERILDDEFLRFLEASRNADAQPAARPAMLGDMAATLSQRFDVERKRLEKDVAAAAKPQSFLRLYLLLAAILLPLLALIGWQTWRGWQERRVVTEARSVLASEPALRGYPLTLEASDGGRRLVVRGLVPAPEAHTRFIEALSRSLSNTTVEHDTGILPATPTPQFGSRERIELFARDNAVFFGNGTELADERSAQVALRQLAGLMKNNDVVVRVIGYTDERGDPTANLQLAQSRADRVAELLVAEGVPRNRLAVVGRGLGRDIARSTGVTSANRRVSFELGYIGEPAP